MKPIRKLLFIALTLIFAACSNPGPSVTGYWKTATSTSGYLWLNLTDNNGSVSGTTGVSTSTSSLPISGTRSGSNLSVQIAVGGSSIEYTGPVSGDTFSSTAKICSPSCTSGPIAFTRGAAPLAASASVKATTSSEPLIEQIKKFIR
jgi:hypothetical protein